MGIGDVNGDGRLDLLEKNGWWEQPASLAGDPVWTFHQQPIGSGGSQMYAYDVNGDGLNDIITALAAHGFGLAWYEQSREGGEIKFREHIIMNKEPKENKYGVKFSELHAIDLVDMDGDGLKDIVTGKRFWSHGRTGDPDRNDAAVLYWFKLARGADKSVDFVPYLIDNESGVGTQVVAGDINGDGLPDIVVGQQEGHVRPPAREEDRLPRGVGEGAAEADRAMTPIGFMRTSFSDTAQIPKGPDARHDADGIIELDPAFEAGLQDIEGFSHLYISVAVPPRGRIRADRVSAQPTIGRTACSRPGRRSGPTRLA